MTLSVPNLSTEASQPDPSVRMMLRKYCLAAIKNHTLAEGRVWDNRPTRPSRAELPCILIHTKEETAETFEDPPRSYERELSLWIDIYAEGTEGDEQPMDLVDVIASQVERRMHLVQHEIVQAGLRERTGGEPLGFSFSPRKSGYRGTSMDTDAEGAQLEAGCRITWALVYVTEVDEASLTSDKITPFAQAVVDWDIDGDGVPDATDDIHPEQP